MIPLKRAPVIVPAGIRRLASIGSLDEAAIAILLGAAGTASTVRQRRELTTEGAPITHPLLLLEGWAARVRILHDGRRQFIGFVLPGDVIGLCGFDQPIAASTIVALTALTTCRLPAHERTDPLGKAFAVSRALDEAHLMSQIVRLGRLDARERIIDLLLELHERLSLAGLTAGDGFACPLTQEMLADVLGLTSVHVNRMVQAARRRGELAWSGQTIRLPDIRALRDAVGRKPPRVA